MVHSVIGRQLLEINRHYSGRAAGKEVKGEGDKDCIEEMRDEDEQEEDGHVDSNAEDEEVCEKEEERDVQ